MGERLRRLLVRAPNWVGDAVMATPALRALRRAHPEAEIAVAGPAFLRDLLKGHPHVDRLLPLARRGGLRALARDARALARERFDAALLLPDSPRAALPACAARIPRRVGYARDPLRRALLTQAVPSPREGGRRVPVSMIERYLRVTRALGVPDAGEATELAVDAGARKRVRARLAAAGLAPDAPYAVVTPGASFGSSKLWPAAHFAAACDGLARERGLRAVLAPGPGEEAVARAVAARAAEWLPALTDPAIPLDELVALVAGSALVLTNDTGPRHVAVALGRPVVVLMGPTDPRHTAHLLERQCVLREPVACSPCHYKVCPIDHRCMTRIAPERVTEAAAELLA